jgi:two-component system chemotaxis sensor kinase CheA
MDEAWGELVEGFREEAGDLLQGLTDLILALEMDPGNREAAEELFRKAHTLKGAAGLVGASRVSEVTHILEEVLEDIAAGKKVFSAEVADLLLQGFDYVKELVETFAAGGPVDEGKHQQLLETLAALRGREASGGGKTGSLDSAGSDLLLKLTPETWAKILDVLGEEEKSVYQVVLKFDPELFFTGQDPLLILEDILGAGDVVEFICHTDDLPPLDEIDPERIYVWFEIYLSASSGVLPELEGCVEFLDPEFNLVLIRELSYESLLSSLSMEVAVCREFRDVVGPHLGRIKKLLTAIHRVLVLTPATEERTALSNLATLLKEECLKTALETHAHERLRCLVFALCVFAWMLSGCVSSGLDRDSEQKLEETLRDLRRSLELLLGVSAEVERGSCRAELEGELPEERKKVLREILRQQKLYLALNRGKRENFSPSLFRVISCVALALGCSEVAERVRLFSDLDWDSCLEVVSRLEALVGGEEEGEAQTATEPRDSLNAVVQAPVQTYQPKQQTKKYLRIEESRIEKLFELAGELVVAKNSLPYLVRKLELHWGLPEAAKELKERYQVFERISRELQDLAMEFRLLPVSQIFQRFPRFVRDVSRTLGKQVRLVIEGEETQVDKTVLEKIYEPLVHLVRNSLDHGLELPEERVRLGKEAEGRLVLRAGREGHFVFIEVSDDGRGIDPGRIREAVVRKGLVREQEVSQLSDDEVIHYIFHPGFSTAEKASELSGRGVGMDVVKDTVEQLGGSMQLSNSPGSGLTVRLSFPLTLATTKVLVVRAGSSFYGLPLEAVEEVLRVEAEQFQLLGGKEAVYLRGRTVPVFRLGELLGLLGSGSEEYNYVVVLKAGVGLVVDDFESELDVLLKPLPGELGRVKLYAGGSLLPDGSILLVLNPEELLTGGTSFHACCEKRKHISFHW